MDVDILEASAGFFRLVEDGHQVDDGIHACERLRQGLGVVDVRFDQLEVGDGQKMPVAFAVTGEHLDVNGLIGEAVGDLPSDKTGAAENANAADAHGCRAPFR
jgi:hypothetical protein